MPELNPGSAGSMNEAIKLRYEANADTNAFTDAEKTKLGGIASGAQVNAIEAGPARFYAFHDFTSAATIPDIVTDGTGTGWGVVVRTDMLIADAIGTCTINLGTVATNRAGIRTALTLFQLDNGKSSFATYVRQTALADVTNTFTQRIGFLDSMTAEPVDGCYFRYAYTVNGGRYEAVCRSNSVETGSVVDTGITATVNTNYKFRVEVNAAGTSAQFFINGSSVATITTNIPTGSARLTGAGIATIRSAGTASLSPLVVDYMMVEQIPTASRI